MQEMLVQWLVTGFGMAAWGVPFIWLLFYISRGYLTSYANKKGENLATKEDVRAITKEIEAAKEEFSHRLEDLKAHHQLRMVAAERRMQAHQEGYVIWRELVNSSSKKNERLEKAIDSGHEWYEKNLIFLGKESRRTLHAALLVADLHPDLLEDRDVEGLKKNKAILWAPLDHLLREVELPPLSQENKNEIRDSG